MPAAGKAQRNRLKQVKPKAKVPRGAIELKSLKERKASVTRLAARLSLNQITVSPFSASSPPKNRSGFAASLQKHDKQQATRL